MSRLCDNCTRALFDGTCAVPNDENSFEWKKQRDLLEDDGTCSYYHKETLRDKLIDILSTPYHKLNKMFTYVGDIIKYSIFNRIKYGFDVRDTWSLDVSISKFIVPRLVYFIDNKPTGVPSQLTDKQFVEKHGLSIYFNSELQDEWFSNNSDITEPYNAWINILTAILYPFQYEYNSDTPTYTECYMSINEYGEKSIDSSLFKKHTHDYEEGLRLFSIFFQNLWD